jgi:hypothetical protein
VSSENVVTISRIYEAFENRDSSAFVEFLSPDIHVTQCPQIPWGGVFQGLDVGLGPRRTTTPLVDDCDST